MKKRTAIAVFVLALLTILAGFILSRCVAEQYATGVYVAPIGLWAMIVMAKWGMK